ncbi:MAG TPA: FTR1 family protein, partial [Acidimicrobiales bacterium]|nr:FTR1 family protein [Acidimicrobiales bacterium]
VVATISMTGSNAWDATGGAFLGVAVALAAGVAVVRGSTRLDVARFFRITALVLVLTAAGIAMATVHTANAAGWITFGQTPQYDLPWLAPPGSVLSSFTTGMLGLQPYPVLIEVVAWLAYFVPMTIVVAWPRRRFRRAAPPRLEGAAPAAPRTVGAAAAARSAAPAAAASASAAATRAAAPAAAAPGGATAGSNVPRSALRRRSPWIAVGAVVVGVITYSGVSASTPEPARQQASRPSGNPGSGRGHAPSLPTGATTAGHQAPGAGHQSGVDVPLAARPAPRPAASASPRSRILFASLAAVDCASVARCTAVGDFLPVDKDAASGDPDGDGHAAHTLVETFDAGRWRVVQSPDEGHGGAVLSDVSCPAASDCVAVGYYIPDKFPLTATTAPPSFPLVESNATGRWNVVPSPRVAANSVLQGVSCASTSSCVAVGYTASASAHGRAAGAAGAAGAAIAAGASGTGPSGATSASAGTPDESFFVEAYDGAAWHTVPVTPPAGTSSGLNAVSCPSAASCVAVGEVAPSSAPSATQPLVERLSDGRWTQVPLPAQVAGPGILYKVRCAAPEHCLAVGNTEVARRSGAALVIAQAGSTWSADGAALAEVGDTSLTALSCSGSTADCLVSGLSWTSLQAAPSVVLARVGPTSWHALDASALPGSVEGLACTGASSCVAVGNVAQNNFGNTLAMVEGLSGSSWSSEPTPLP